MNVRMGIVLRNARMIGQLTNIYSLLFLIVITLVRQLISAFKCIREINISERGHVYL